MKKFMREASFFFPWMENRRVHFVGIGGIGVSSLARWFLAQKWAVFGSDASTSALLRELKKEGIRVKIGHKKGNISAKTGLVVYSSAVSSKNPELLEARRRGIPTLSYPEALEALTWVYMTVAIAGAHGKSTTTSLLSLMLVRGRKDPTVIVGTKLREFGRGRSYGSNFRDGKSGMLVLEADEFHSSFLHYSPAAALITNVDREHLDWYGTFANVKKAFLEFVGNIRQGGVVVLNRDDATLRLLAPKMEKIAKDRGVRVVWFTVRSEEGNALRSRLHIPGSHNFSNAVGAFTLARILGVPERDAQKALEDYRGVWRRFEYKGKWRTKKGGSVKVYDDYGHHPTEVKKTLEGAKTFFEGAKIICVFQAHQARRLKTLFGDFINAFNAADSVIILPTYTVLGRDTIDARYSSKKLAERVAKRGKVSDVVYCEEPKNIHSIVRRITEENGNKDCIVIMMGAGTIVKYTKNLLRK